LAFVTAGPFAGPRTDPPARAQERPLLVRAALGFLIAATIYVHLHYLVQPYRLVFLPLHQIGIGVLHSRLPFRDFNFEYPALAAVTFIPAGLWGAHPDSMFAVQALVAEAVTVFLLFRHNQALLLRWFVLSLVVFPFLSGGFDGWAMLAIAASTLLLAEGRAGGWWVAAAGMAIKLSPAAVVVWSRARLRALIPAAAVGVAATFGPLAISRGGNADFLGYSLHRGTQAESVAASISILITNAAGHVPHYVGRFGGLELVGGKVETWVVALAGAALLMTIALRARRADPWFASFATVLVILCANKVFSPQYIVWAAPLAVMVGRWWYRAFLVAAVLTATPYLFLSFTLHHVVYVAIVRNAVLVTLAIAAVVQLALIARAGSSPTAPPRIHRLGSRSPARA
jgi:hypothetical protein